MSKLKMIVLFIGRLSESVRMICQIKCELRIFDYLAVTRETGMQLLVVINLEQAQVKSLRLLLFCNYLYDCDETNIRLQF